MPLQAGCRGLLAVAGGCLFGLLAVAGGCLRGLLAVARGRSFFFYLGANCTLWRAASAAWGRNDFLLGASTSGSDRRPGHARHQARDTQPGQHFLQVLLFHVSLLL